MSNKGENSAFEDLDDWSDESDQNKGNPADGSEAEVENDWADGDFSSNDEFLDDPGRADDDGDDDGDDDDDDGGVSAQEDKPKPNKLKLYALIAGIGTLLVGVIGGGLYMNGTFGSRSAPAQEPRPQMAVVPAADQRAAQPAQRVAPEDRLAPKAAPGNLDLDTPARIQERPIDRPADRAARSPAPVDGPDASSSISAVDARDTLSDQQQVMIDELSEKADMLAGAVTKFRSEINASIEPMAKDLTGAQTTLGNHEERLNALEAKIKEINDAIDALSKSKPSTRPATQPAAKPANKPAAKPAAAPPKPASRQASGPAEKPAAPSSVGSLAGYSVVATYPSTTSKGVSPQKAWVTNGERLIQLTVGSMIEGAKVSRIEGTNVHTNRGVIRAPK